MENKEFFELTNPQKNIWNMELFFSNTNINNICVSSILDETINFITLKKAINKLVELNESFRIHLLVKDSVPVQYIGDFVPFDIDIIEAESKKDFSNIEQEMVNEKFELINNNLFKFKFVKFPDGKGGIILNVHHIIADSWSLGITIKEIIKIYHTLLEGNEYASDTFPYTNLIENEKAYKNSNRYEEDKKFWNTYLSNLSEPITIPAINKQSSLATTVAKRSSFVVDLILAKKISDFCALNKISTYAFFMSVFSLYIANVSDSDDLILGTPILNRLNFKDKLTTGMFVTTMPFRCKIDSSDSFINYATSNSINLTSILRHQRYPYSEIIEDVRKDNSDIPNLYNIAVSYQITKAVSDDIGKYEANWAFNNNCLNDINIHLYDINNTGSIEIDYDYLSEKYTEEEISLNHSRILYMIEEILGNPSISLKEIEVVTPEEKNQILNVFNNRTLDCPFESNIIKLFEEQVNKNPDNIALVYKDQTFTYQDLNKIVNKLARCLKSKGILTNDIVGVYMNKNAWFITSILAIQKLGAAYLPMHPDYPEDRVSYILEDSQAKLLLTDQTSANINCEVLNPELLNLNDFEDSNLGIDFPSDTLCYVIYTSGSTGKPKGVMLTHSNLINFLYTFNDCFDNKFCSEDKCLSLTNISFDVSVCEIYTPLVFGSTLVIYPRNTLTDIHILCDILDKQHITFLYLPPSVLNDVYKFVKTNNYSFFVNKLLVGVEAIKNGDLNNLLSLNNNLEIINGYGPTEATICSTFFKYSYSDNFNHIVPIGYPIKNNNVYIINKFNNLQPIEMPGELCVSGKNVSLGYLNNSEAMEKSFSSLYNSLFYKTGDSAYWNKDGFLQFIGRKDSQVKFRGHRIELNEINNNIKSISGINNSITLLLDIHGIPCICCYVSISDLTLNESYIKSELNSVLPYYMIPSHIICLNDLPINKNGKIDKSLLPEISIDETNIVKPTTATQAIVANIICKLLNLDEVSILDDFFAIGMDSLLAIRFSIEIYNRLKKNLSIKDIFQNNTIEQLSEFLDNSTIEISSYTIKKAQKEDFYPLSSAQKRIFYSSSIAGNSSVLYNLPGGIILSGLPDVKKLENCFNILIKRHESLRTYFEIIDGTVVQKVSEQQNLKLVVSTAKFENIEKCFNNFIKPFDLSKAPLLRAKIVKFDNNKCLLLFDTHHIISDGLSMKILVKEICSLYNDKTPMEPKLTYKDFAVWENNELISGNFEQSKKFWINQFNDEIPTLNLPSDFSRPSTRTFNGSKIHKEIDSNLTANIYSLAKKYSVTPYMILLSAYYILLSKYSLQDDIIVGTPIIGRDNSQLSNVLGMFVNTLPLRAKIDSNLSFTDFLLNIKSICINAFKNQTYPSNELINDLKLKRDSSRNPLFDIVFNYQNSFVENTKLGNLKASYYIPDTKISKFDLSLEVIPTRSKLNLNFEYSTDLFKYQSIENLANHYLNILKAIIDNSNIAITELSMLSDEEENKILNVFNNTNVPYPKDSCIIDLFKEHVLLSPNKTAVVFEGNSLTYLELDKKSSQLAKVILSQNISAGSIIALLLDKSLEMIISILAVLKANCAFLPIDISYPQERIDYMLKDSKSSILITTNEFLRKSNYTIKILNVNIEESSIFNDENLEMSFSRSFPEDLAYIMYTSGSTGNPKGVMIRQKSIIRLVKNPNFIKFSKHEHILQSGSIVFDASTFEIWSALLNGFELYIIKKEDLLNPDTLQNYLIENKISILWLTAPLFNQLVEENPHMFNTVHYLLTGGDVLSPKHINMAMVANPNLKIINGYGPTENTTFSTCFQVDKKYEDNIPIGYPISNSTCYVCSPNEKLVPIGVPGELYVGGDGLAIGYLNNSDLTNKKFIDFNLTNNKIYKTGDLVRWLPDGSLQFLGRIDSQVKIRGFRVELNEINLKISSFDEIKESTTVVQVINDEKVICCYYVSKNPIDLASLKNYLKNFLPHYMIPSYFIPLDKMPINTNGKVDKKALPLNFNRSTSSVNIEKPTNETESLILDIFKKILNIQDISITDDFFEIGGDSLSAMKLQVEFVSNNLSISYSDIFKYSSVKDLSKFVLSGDSSVDTNYTSDFAKYDKLLKNNTVDNITAEKLKIVQTGNVFLTGVTGFLGAHVLDSFIKNNNFDIYCLIREKNNVSAIDRLKNVLHFYFDSKYDKYIGNRIKLIEGDISQDRFGLSLDDYKNLGLKITTVIHCAALVKHFGTFKEFENINILGTKKIINFCSEFNLRLLHISTISVSGNAFAEDSYIENNFDNDVNYSEENFYIGQNLDNLYVKSKFLAEKLVLDAISEGLEASILRMGNLTSRYSEGKFQQNHFENAFVNRFKSILQIKYAPDYLISGYVEFTPIDFCGDAIIKIAEHFNNKFTVFHLLNNNVVTMDRLLVILENLNIDITVISREKFSDLITSLLNDPTKKSYLEGIINDLNKDKELIYESPVKIKSDFSTIYLKNIGFNWPYIDETYIYNYLKYLSDIGYFDINLK